VFQLSTNYTRGATLERKIKKQLEDEGYYVMRSAGSKGQVDLLALAPDGFAYMIQVSLSKKNKAECTRLYELAHSHSAGPVVAYPDRFEWLYWSGDALCANLTDMKLSDD
jgi:Holliday junction resolvase